MSNISSSALLALLLSLPIAGGCARDGKRSETAARAEEASGEVKRADTFTAKIEAVDRENRALTLREENGEPFTVLVSEEVPMDKLAADKEVKVTYQEAVAFELLDPSSPEAQGETSTVQETTRRRVPDGVQYGREVKTTVQIVAVAPTGTSATFRVPEGDLRTVEVSDPNNQEKISHLRPGDAVEVTYTEKLAVALAD